MSAAANGGQHEPTDAWERTAFAVRHRRSNLGGWGDRIHQRRGHKPDNYPIRGIPLRRAVQNAVAHHGNRYCQGRTELRGRGLPIAMKTPGKPGGLMVAIGVPKGGAGSDAGAGTTDISDGHYAEEPQDQSDGGNEDCVSL